MEQHTDTNGRPAAAMDRESARRAMKLAEDAVPHLGGPAQAEWLERLAAGYDELRAVLAWAGRESPGLQLRLSATLAPYWLARGEFDEGSLWLEAALADTGGPRSPVRLRAVLAAGVFARIQGRHAEARAYLEEAAALFGERGDACPAGVALCELARLAVDEGDLAGARARLAEARAILPEGAAGHWLLAAARVYAAEGDSLRAARVVGAARATGGAPLMAVLAAREREELARDLCAALGDEVFRDACAEGAARAVAVAMGEAGE